MKINAWVSSMSTQLLQAVAIFSLSPTSTSTCSSDRKQSRQSPEGIPSLPLLLPFLIYFFLRTSPPDIPLASSCLSPHSIVPSSHNQLAFFLINFHFPQVLLYPVVLVYRSSLQNNTFPWRKVNVKDPLEPRLPKVSTFGNLSS